jgi:hypothetical protein
MAANVKNWNAADRRYGWRFGGETGLEVVGVRDAARLTGLSHTYLYELLKDDDRETPGARAYPLRKGKRPHNGDICICKRSIEEFNKLRIPVEV